MSINKSVLRARRAPLSFEIYVRLLLFSSCRNKAVASLVSGTSIVTVEISSKLLTKKFIQRNPTGIRFTLRVDLEKYIVLCENGPYCMQIAMRISIRKRCYGYPRDNLTIKRGTPSRMLQPECTVSDIENSDQGQISANLDTAVMY